MNEKCTSDTLQVLMNKEFAIHTQTYILSSDEFRAEISLAEPSRVKPSISIFELKPSWQILGYNHNQIPRFLIIEVNSQLGCSASKLTWISLYIPVCYL